MAIIIKTYKIRLYPNKAQEQHLLKTVGACRFLYNYFLEKRMDYFKETGKTLAYKLMAREISVLRKEVDWLGEVQADPLGQALRRLDTAYRRAFRKQSNFPKFKSKKDTKQSFQKPKGWNIEGNLLAIQKDFKVKFRGNLNLNAELGMLVVSKTISGKWFATIAAKEDFKQPKRYTKPIGLDVGLKDLVTTSDGEKYANFQPQKKLQSKLTMAQRTLARRKKGSGRYQKAKVEVAKIHEKISNIRQNYLHQVSNSIVSKNHAMIAVEDLNVKGMMANHKVARAMADASLSELLRQMKYKQEWRGGKLIEVGRFFPSSKTCSKCGDVLKELALSVREWTCQKCGAKHNRDINAAKNILAVAYTVRGENEKVAARRGLPFSVKRGYTKV